MNTLPEVIDIKWGAWYIFRDIKKWLKVSNMSKKVILACVDCGSRNYSTVSKQTQAERLELKKFCKTCATHTNHRETK
jgi:large subunit ribosomal protein L33